MPLKLITSLFSLASTLTISVGSGSLPSSMKPIQETVDNAKGKIKDVMK